MIQIESVNDKGEGEVTSLSSTYLHLGAVLSRGLFFFAGLVSKKTSLSSSLDIPLSKPSMVFPAEKATLPLADYSCANITLGIQEALPHSFIHGNIEQAVPDVHIGEGATPDNLPHDEVPGVPDTDGSCTPPGNDTKEVATSSELRDCEMSSVKKEESEARAALNAKVVQTSVDKKASAPWHSSMEVGSEKAPKVEDAEEGTIAVDTGALQLDSDGKLNFFLIDAYEEAFGANPGTIFLFGKVMAHLSQSYKFI